jgi:hypothetical protein
MTKRRSESFFGMHFDFHAGYGQKNIGENSNPELIARMLDAVKPDYVQCDTKGHAGVTSYPTKVGYPAPEIKSDILRMWRELTAERGIALYAHHSGVWDNTALIHNPDWAAVDAEGNPSKEKNSVFGPYADKLLIPQLIEMARDYGLDGAWVDGECWAVIVDYSKHATDAYFKLYSEAPPKPGDADYSKYLKFNREGFREYVTRYVNAVHEAAPEFQIASNWLYTSFVPEEPTIPVDFLSGDYSPNDSLNTARFEGRCLQNQRLPVFADPAKPNHSWDLMAWGFSMVDGVKCVKDQPQLCQEAAAVIMLGGGFQFYNRQDVGSIQDWPIEMWAELARFCREREALCHNAVPVPQVAILFSERAFYKNKTDMFTPYGNRYVDDMRGLLFAALDAGYSTEILMSHHMLDSDLSRYGAVLVPNLETIETSLKEKLIEYAANGGNLIITGHNSCELFRAYLGVEIDRATEKPEKIFAWDGKRFAPLVTHYCIVRSGETEVTARFAFADSASTAIETGQVASTCTKYGSGTVTGVYFDVGPYSRMKTPVVRDFVGSVIGSVFTPAVRVTNSHLVEVMIMEGDGQLRINLLNTGGLHSDSHYRAFDEIPPLHDLKLELRTGKAPTAIYSEPEHLPLDFVYDAESGVTHVTLPRFDIHCVVTVE